MESTEGAPYQPDIDRYLAGLGEVLARDLVVGVYLTGSVTLGDYQHGRSDLDPLVVTARLLTDSELSALEALHDQLETGSQPHMDATYLPSSLRGSLPPEGADGLGYVVDGKFHRGPEGQELVLWANFAQCGITLAGADVRALGAAPDPAAFRDWNRGNLESYWRRQSPGLRDGLAEAPNDEEIPSWYAVWTATGPGRLLRTIKTGEIISKSEAADYTRELFPEFSDLLIRVKASRLGDESLLYAKQDGLALADLIDRVCDAAGTPTGELEA